MALENPKLFKTFIIIIFFCTSLFFVNGDLFAEESSHKKVHVYTSDKIIPISDFQIKKAKRLFYGLVPVSREAPACADCHYTNYIDTITGILPHTIFQDHSQEKMLRI